MAADALSKVGECNEVEENLLMALTIVSTDLLQQIKSTWDYDPVRVRNINQRTEIKDLIQNLCAIHKMEHFLFKNYT